MTGAGVMLHPAAGQRVWIALGISLGLHLLAVSGTCYRPKPLPEQWPAPVVLQWVQPPEQQSVQPPRTAVLPVPRAPAAQQTHAVPKELLAMPEPTSAQLPVVSAVPGVAVVPSATPRVELSSLIANARELARAGKPPTAKPDQPAWLEKSRAPEIERALQRKAAGEHWLSNGLLRVVSASGQSYCLQPTPEFARGGPVEPMSVPTTCP